MLGTLIRTLAFSEKAQRGWNRLTRPDAGSKKGREEFYKRIWEEAALALGGSASNLGHSLFEIRDGNSVTRVCDKYTALDDPVTILLTEDKPLVYRILGENSIPVPHHCVCSSNDVATGWRFAQGLSAALVVKPARGTDGGNGVTANVRGRPGLVRAMARAGAFCDEVLLERQIEGESFRLLYLDGVMIDAVRRIPIVLAGDGKATIRRLLRKANLEAGPSGRFPEPLRLDGELKRTLRSQGLRLHTVPPEGQPVRVQSVTRGTREWNERVDSSICPELARTGAEAARILGVRLAGIDVITSDPALPLASTSGAVIEVNAPPGLYYHYVTNAGSRPVAEMILRRLLCEPSGAGTSERLEEKP